MITTIQLFSSFVYKQQQDVHNNIRGEIMSKCNTGERPGKGTYTCTECGQTIHLDERDDKMPPCPKCNNTSFK